MLGGSQHAVIAGEGACSVQLRGTVSGAGTADVQAEPHQAGRPNSAALTAVLENPRCSSFERLSALISKEIDIPRQARDQNAPAGTASGPDPVIDPVQSFDTFAQQNDFDTDTATEMANRLAERGADGAEAALLDRWIARNSKRVDVNAAGVRSSRARVLLRQQKFAEAKALLAPVLYTNVANVVLNAAIAEAGLGNRSQSEALLSRAERAYVGRSANAVDRGVCTALWGDSKGAAAAFFAGNKDDDFASFARALSIVLPRGRSEGGNAPGTAEHTTPAGFDVKTFAGEFFGPAADAEKRRFGARLAHQLTTYPNAHARDAFLGSIPRTLDWGTDPGPALDVYMALRRNPSSTAASEARLFLEGAVPPPQRKGPFGDFALLAGAYDLFDDVIVAPTTFATPTEESNLMVAVIAKAASMGPSDPVKKLADRISAPKSHYGFAAKWMAVSDPAVTEDSMIQLATDARKGAEISCYLGLGFAMRGDHEKAIRYLRATVRSNHPRLMEVRLAEQILRKYQTHSLEGLPPGLPR
jgi:hypothetical protein